MLRRSSSWWCAAAAVIAIFVMPVALGCSKVSSGSAAGGGNPWTVPGVVRIGAYEDLDTLDPVLSDEFYATNIFQLIFSGLIDYDDHGNPIPDLALTVPSLENGGISRDGKTITYRLHRGVTWSDGAPLTAADVVFTYRQIMNSANNVAYRFPYDEAISVTAPDPYTVVVRLRAPSAPFVANFMRNGNVGSIVPEHLLAGNADLNRVPFNSDPVGSGPFVVARWDPGAMLDLKPNPHYFRGPPSVAEIQYRIIPNQNSLLTSVESHSIDLYMDATESQYPILTHVQGYRVVLTPSFDYEHVTFNCSKPPFDDVRVRQALRV
jgi:peptide/nickel transport system substrate-binding protein